MAEAAKSSAVNFPLLIVVLHWAFFVVLGSFSLVGLVCNPLGAIAARREGRPYSYVAFLPGLSGVAAMLIAPLDGWARWAWVPLVADVTILFAVCYLAWRIVCWR